MKYNTTPYLVSLLLFALLTLSSSAAFAQNKEAAAKFFQEGQQAYAGGDYGAAIFKFSQAYQEDPNGIFLYMTSLAYLKSNNFDKAIEFAKKAQDQSADLDADMQARNLARLHAMTHGLELKRHAQSTGVAISEVVTKQQDKQLKPPSETSGIGGLGWAGLGIGVAGVGLMAGSLYFNSKLKELDVDPSTPKVDVPQDQTTQATQYRTLGLTMLSSGAVFTIVGGGLFIYALGNKKNATTLQVMPTRDGGYAGVKLSF